MSTEKDMNKTKNIKIIINADDCGISSVVNEHIEKAILQGKITSTTVMANMEGFEGAVALNKRYKEQISFGWHINLTQGSPLLYSQLLLDKGFYVETDNGIEMNGKKFLHKWLPSAEKDEIRKELMAQYQKLRDNGIMPSHIDSHHHVHTSIWAVTVIPDIIRKTGIKSMRCMFSNKPMGIDLMMRKGWAQIMKLQVAGLNMPDVLCGYEEFMTKGLLAKGGIVELECHPGHPKYVQEENLLMTASWKDKYSLINYNQL